MRLHAKFLVAMVLFALCGAASAQTSAGSSLRVDLKETRLANGLRVITVEDHNSPVIAVSVTYNVGSRNERPGRTGFAHLFEHMMFQGSENVGKSEHFILVYNNGGTMNGTTNEDRTNYFEALPANQLDLMGFQKFVQACVNDRRFTPAQVVPRIAEKAGGLGLLDKVVVYPLGIHLMRDGVAGLLGRLRDSRCGLLDDGRIWRGHRCRGRLRAFGLGPWSRGRYNRRRRLLPDLANKRHFEPFRHARCVAPGGDALRDLGRDDPVTQRHEDDDQRVSAAPPQIDQSPSHARRNASAAFEGRSAGASETVPWAPPCAASATRAVKTR